MAAFEQPSFAFRFQGVKHVQVSIDGTARPHNAAWLKSARSRLSRADPYRRRSKMGNRYHGRLQLAFASPKFSGIAISVDESRHFDVTGKLSLISQTQVA